MTHRLLYDFGVNASALTLANALIFQAELADVDGRVRPLRDLLSERDLAKALDEQWELINDKIDYVPIFELARRVLLQLPARAETNEALKTLSGYVLQIVTERAALRHDLMGRIYHRLLPDQKYLGTYYTRVPAATLLLKLAMDTSRWPTDWGDIDAVAELRIGDLACGTGTLLMAAQQATTDNHVRAMSAKGRHIGRPELLARGYHLEFIVTSHDPDQWNFSENTSLSEVLLVAKKIHRPPGTKADASLKTTCISLWNNKFTPIDALAVAESVLKEPAVDIESNDARIERGVSSVSIGSKKVGEAVQVPWQDLKAGQWYPCAFAHADVIRAAHFLRKASVLAWSQSTVGTSRLGVRHDGRPITIWGGIGVGHCQDCRWIHSSSIAT